MVSDLVIKAIVHHSIGDFDTSGKDLIQMAAKFMGDNVWVECTLESMEEQLLVHVVDVVVKVTTYHDVSIGILLDDISHSLRSILLGLLITRFEVAV